MSEFLMPSLGADMEAGTLVEWLVKPGEQVNHGDTIAVVETQKGAIEIEVFVDGTLDKYLVEIGKKVPVGTPLATILQAGETGAEAPQAVSKPEKAEPVSEPTPILPPKVSAETVPTAASFSGEHVRITPAARRLAGQSNIDLTALRDKGTGPVGAVTLQDVEALIAEQPSTTKLPDMTGMRQAIAAAMSRSKKEIPHYYLAHTVDVSKAETFIANFNATCPAEDRLLLGAVFIKAVAKAVEKYPEFNGYYTDGHFQHSEAVNIGMVINIRGGGLVAPAIHNMENLTLDGTMSAMHDLVARARSSGLKSSELSGSTITVSSLGSRGVETIYGIIFPPQVAIIGFGTPTERPLVIDGKLEARQSVVLTLAADHRVSDGHRGALFLNKINKYLQKPEAL